MAVIKSSALGQARKSIGATNYYRRSGVQISRNKPVFAPSRTFTEAQLLQQYTMKLMQNLMLVRGAKVIADYCNVPNNRKYNASSRYNRFLRGVMPQIRKTIGSTMPDEEDFWNEKGTGVLMYYSTGNVEWFATGYQGSSNTDMVTIYVDIDDLVLRRVLANANKRRVKSSQFTNVNIGCCGFIQELPLEGSALDVLQPTMVDMTSIEEGGPLGFIFDVKGAGLYAWPARAVLSFFLTDRVSDVSNVPLSIPQFCTSSRYILNLPGLDSGDSPGEI